MYFWKKNPLFWLVETGYLASRNHFFPFFRYSWQLAVGSWQLKIFPAQCKFIFTTNFLFWLDETDFLASGNYFVPVHQISFILEIVVDIYFKRILYYGQCQRIFFLMGTILSHSYFFETIIAIRGRPFSLIFSDTNSNGSSFLIHFNRIFQLILHSG